MSPSSKQNPDPDNGSPVPKKRRRRSAIPPIKVVPTDPTEFDERTLVERFVDGGPGLLVSLAVHGIILIAMAWYTYHATRAPSLDTIDAGWFVDKRAGSKSLQPVRIEAFTAKADSSVKRKPQAGVEDGATTQAKQPGPTVQPVNVDQLLKDRDPDKAIQLVRQHGGDERTMRTISQALAWLSRQQQSGGNWSLHEGYPDAGLSVIRTDTGATALALLPLLGAGHSPVEGEYSAVVKKGIGWLVGVQDSDGNFHDHDELGRQTAFYAHSQATIAVCEAFAMTGDENLREPAQRAIGFLLSSQQPTTGGWKYRPLDEDSVADLSVTGWALMALHAARTAGIEVPEEHFQRASRFLDIVSEQNGRRYKYEPTDPADRVSLAMTAEGFLCRQFLGADPSDPAITDGISFLMEERNRPSWTLRRRNVYEWYYVGHVLHNAQGDHFTQWYQQVALAIVDNQTKSGTTRRGKDVRGSWHPSKPIGSPHEYAEKAGRLYLTSLCTLILEMPFRYRSVSGGG